MDESILAYNWWTGNFPDIMFAQENTQKITMSFILGYLTAKKIVTKLYEH